MNSEIERTIWGGTAIICLALSLSLLVWVLAGTQALAEARGGRRGARRREFFSEGSRLEPLLRLMGGLMLNMVDAIQGVNPQLRSLLLRLREWQRKRLVWAGEPAGLCVPEVFALSLFLAILFAAVACFYGYTSGNLMWILPATVLGGSLVNLRLRAIAAERFVEMSHSLPSAIDLVALAMNAGSDFPSAIRKITAGHSGVVADEFSQVLLSLDLGITRSAALLALGERCPVEEVRDLVRAVVLAEKKGSSVAEALAQQAHSSRQRRSVRAEEAAARAGVLLMLPLMFLMACVMILLVGPLFVSGGSL